MISRFLRISLIIEDPFPKVLPDYSSVKIFNGSPLPFNYIQLSGASITLHPDMYPELQSNQAVFHKSAVFILRAPGFYTPSNLPSGFLYAEQGFANQRLTRNHLRGFHKYRCLGLAPRDPDLIVPSRSWTVVFFKSSPGDSRVESWQVQNTLVCRSSAYQNTHSPGHTGNAAYTQPALSTEDRAPCFQAPRDCVSHVSLSPLPHVGVICIQSSFCLLDSKPLKDRHSVPHIFYTSAHPSYTKQASLNND